MRARTLVRTFVLLGLAGVAPACAADESSVGGVLPAAPGLLAGYFDGRDFQQPSGVYRDLNIDFEGWQLNERVLSRGHVPRALSIRWTGQIWFERGDTYTISFELRGRVRLWIDDAPIVDDWVDSGILREARGSTSVPDRGWRELRIDWDQLDGPMTARLRAESPSRPRAIVTPGELRHLDPPTGAMAAQDRDGIDVFENTWAVPLSAVTAVARSPHGIVVGGVSEAAELFWDAWLIPVDGGPPRRLAAIGDNLISVDASGALWTTVTREDEHGNAAYEVRRSPSDGSPSVLLSTYLHAARARE